jgi:AcrR family transcriptional regulator
MPKAFTDKEKEAINERLLEGGRQCIARFGIRKTTVDDLARIAGISKGAFYLFYPTKEHLFYDVVMDCDEGLHQKFERSMAAMAGEVTLPRFIDRTIEWIKEVEGTFLITIFQNGELEYLERKLPDELSRRHHIGDEEMVARLFEMLRIPPPENIAVFAGALRSVFLTLLNKKSVGEDIYYDVLRELLAALFAKFIR